MAWIKYKKSYDNVPYYWILESLELVQVSDNIVNFIKRSMKDWNTELSPLLSVIYMIPSHLCHLKEWS